MSGTKNIDTAVPRRSATSLGSAHGAASRMKTRASGIAMDQAASGSGSSSRSMWIVRPG
jgi:hypothetical protein